MSSFRELVSNPSWKQPQKRLRCDPHTTLLRNGCPRRVHGWSWVRWNGEKKERRRYLRLVHYRLTICDSASKNAKVLHTCMLKCDSGVEFSPKRKEFVVDSHVFTFQTLSDFKAWAFAVRQGVRNPKHYYDFSQAEEIGSGAFSQVLLVPDRNTGERVAIKVVDKSCCSKSVLTAATNEAMVCARVHNDAIVRCYDVFDTPACLYVVLEYASAGSLEDRQYLHATEAEVATVVRRILQALVYMEKNGLVHRDLKPENILVRSGGKSWANQVVISDLGLCALIGDSKALRQVCCSLQYAAPEVLTQCDREYGSKVDVYGCGVIAFWLLSRGELPFDGDTMGEVYRAIKCGKFFMDGSVWRNVSDEAKSFCRSLLQPSPNIRLSALAALHHPWLCLSNPSDLQGVKSDNWRVAVKSVIATLRLRKMVAGNCDLGKLVSPRSSNGTLWQILRMAQQDQFAYGSIDSCSSPALPPSPSKSTGNNLDKPQNSLQLVRSSRRSKFAYGSLSSQSSRSIPVSPRARVGNSLDSSQNPLRRMYSQITRSDESQSTRSSI